MSLYNALVDMPPRGRNPDVVKPQEAVYADREFFL